MKLLIYLAAVTSLSFFASCATFSKAETAQEEVFFDDGYQKNSGAEVIIDDKSLSRDEADFFAASARANTTEVMTTVNVQGKAVSTMTDSAGNKSESVCYENHPLVGCVALKTSVKGEKEILVYAQNGTVKVLPADKIPDIYTVSANEAASVAGITEGRKYDQAQPIFAQKPQNSAPLQPMPSYTFNVQKIPAVESVQSANDSAAAGTDNNSGEGEAKGETTSQNPLPDQDKEN